MYTNDNNKSHKFMWMKMKLRKKKKKHKRLKEINKNDLCCEDTSFVFCCCTTCYISFFVLLPLNSYCCCLALKINNKDLKPEEEQAPIQTKTPTIMSRNEKRWERKE